MNRYEFIDSFEVKLYFLAIFFNWSMEHLISWWGVLIAFMLVPFLNKNLVRANLDNDIPTQLSKDINGDD